MGIVDTEEDEAAAAAELLSIVVAFDIIEAAPPPPPFNHASNLSLSSVKEAADGEWWGTLLSFDGETLPLLSFVSLSFVSMIAVLTIYLIGAD